MTNDDMAGLLWITAIAVGAFATGAVVFWWPVLRAAKIRRTLHWPENQDRR